MNSYISSVKIWLCLFHIKQPSRALPILHVAKQLTGENLCFAIEIYQSS